MLVFYDVTQLKAYEGLRSDFIANLTHEIRTPLSALCGYAETLLDGVDDPDARSASWGSSNASHIAWPGWSTTWFRFPTSSAD